jgi:predicted TIM-barrel fold metal-dependent hydrolase
MSLVFDANTHPITWPVLRQFRLEQERRAARVPSNFLNTADGNQVYESLFHQEPEGLADLLVSEMDDCGIDRAVIMPTVFHCPNQLIAEMVSAHPKRLVGFGRWEWPARGRKGARQVRAAIRDLGLQGIGEIAFSEFYPTPPLEIHRLPEFRLMMDEVAALGVPIVFDSGYAATPRPHGYYDPLIIDTVACDYPEVPMILFHSGKTDPTFFESARITARRHHNVYLEVSYQPSENIAALVSELGADRILFGTDWFGPTWSEDQSESATPNGGPEGETSVLARTLSRVRGAGLTKDQEEAVLGGNLLRLLGPGQGAAGEG